MSRIRNHFLPRALPLLAFLLLLGSFAASCHRKGEATGPSISFSLIPEAGEGGSDRLEPIRGHVSGVGPEQKIILYAKTNIWWVQPFSANPYTEIQQNGDWSSTIHLGSEYAALLVSKDYKPHRTMENLPAIGGQILAVAVVAGRPGPRAQNKILHFSGYDWHIRSSTSERGGRPNKYSPDNAWVDPQGFLHLRISRQNGQWYSSEVNLNRSFGYGTYSFVVRNADKLDPAVVLGMFTWDDHRDDQQHREMAIELSTWGNPNSRSAQYVIQPYYIPANVYRFDPPHGLQHYTFRWEPGRVVFSAFAANSVTAKAKPANEHVFVSGIPIPGNESVHMNLYVFGRSHIPLKKDVEVIIEKFEYLP